MLNTLTIRDLALIENAEISYTQGLNVISGETGGGKSLVIAALQLLRGEKARADMVRHGAENLAVIGEFYLGDSDRSLAAVEAVRELCGIELDDDLLIITRIVDPKGRSRARVNGQPVTMTVLRELGSWLLEIHGQGDSRALMRSEIQCETLDAFAGTRKLRGEFARTLIEARASRERHLHILGGERERQERLEFLRYQLIEMQSLELEAGEVQRLEQEHRLLGHLDHMRELLATTLDSLQEGDACASDLLGKASKALREAADIDHDLASAAEQVTDAEVNVAEACRSVQSGLSRLDLDPSRLAAVEERLAEVRKGLSRFGPTDTDFFSRLIEVADELDQIADAAQSPEALARELANKTATLAEIGRKLLRARRKAVARFTSAIESELAGLGMTHTKFGVEMSDQFATEELLDQATSHGPTSVDFTVRINAGEPERSMRDTASGGEMARIVLAIKKCIADQDRVPFLIFDEVDAEIGGRLGFAVGAKLRDVAAHHQVLIVTHLPQVAAFGEAHFKVSKAVHQGRTTCTVARLGAKEIERELAAMSSGEGADQNAIREARRMVQKAKSATFPQGGKVAGSDR